MVTVWSHVATPRGQILGTVVGSRHGNLSQADLRSPIAGDAEDANRPAAFEKPKARNVEKTRSLKSCLEMHQITQIRTAPRFDPGLLVWLFEAQGAGLQP